MAQRKKPESRFSDELIDQLLEGQEDGAHLLGNEGLIGALKKRLAERLLETEMDVHLDDPEQQAASNHRNGRSSKTVTLDDGRVLLDIPRDRHGQFDPALIPKKEILGLWIEQTEGAKFWMRVMTELKARGVADLLIAVVDGLRGFPDAVVQTCIVQLIRSSMQCASWKERKAIAHALKPICGAVSGDGPGRIRARRLGPEIPADRGQLAPELGAGDPVLRLLCRGPQDHLRHQRGRESA